MVHEVSDLPRTAEALKPTRNQYLWALWIVLKLSLVLLLSDAGQATVIYQNF